MNDVERLHCYAIFRIDTPHAIMTQHRTIEEVPAKVTATLSTMTGVEHRHARILTTCDCLNRMVVEGEVAPTPIATGEKSPTYWAATLDSEPMGHLGRDRRWVLDAITGEVETLLEELEDGDTFNIEFGRKDMTQEEEDALPEL